MSVAPGRVTLLCVSPCAGADGSEDFMLSSYGLIGPRGPPASREITTPGRRQKPLKPVDRKLPTLQGHQHSAASRKLHDASAK